MCAKFRIHTEVTATELIFTLGDKYSKNVTFVCCIVCKMVSFLEK